MENQEINEVNETTPQLLVTEDMRSHIYETAKWTNFLAISGFVIAGLTLLSAFTIGSAITTNPQLAAMMGPMGKVGYVAITLMLLCYSLAIFYPSLLMHKYASKAKLGVLYGDQASLTEALSKMRSLFKYWGILMIVLICFYVLLIILQILIGAAV